MNYRCFSLCTILAMLLLIYRGYPHFIPSSWSHLPQASHYPSGDLIPQDLMLFLIWLVNGSPDTQDLLDLGGLDLSEKKSSSILITHARGGRYLFGLALRSKKIAISEMNYSSLNKLDMFERITYEDYILPTIPANRQTLVNELSSIKFLFKLSDSCGNLKIEKRIEGSYFKDKQGYFGSLPGENEYPYAIEFFLPDIKESLWNLQHGCAYKVDIEVLEPAKGLSQGIQANFIVGLPGWYQLSLQNLIHHLGSSGFRAGKRGSA